DVRGTQRCGLRRVLDRGLRRDLSFAGQRPRIVRHLPGGIERVAEDGEQVDDRPFLRSTIERIPCGFELLFAFAHRRYSWKARNRPVSRWSYGIAVNSASW